MAIQLKKGSSIDINKDSSVQKIMIGLGWDTGEYIIDLDASAFMIGEDGKIPVDEYFVFYNNLKSPDGALIHTGDNRTGEGDGDDEMILADLSKVNQDIKEIILVVSIYDATRLGHHFGLLKNAFIRIFDVENKEELFKFTLDDRLENFTEIEIGKLHREGNHWKFTALGIGSQSGLQSYVTRFI